MSFFANFGTVWITLSDGSKMLINDITAYVAFSKVWGNDKRTQLTYKIKDGELPHQISNRLYDTVDYWWTILLLNNIYDFDNQWPRNSDQLDDFIALKYPNNLSSDVHHYITADGLVADLLSLRIKFNTSVDATVIDSANLESISIYEYEVAKNDAKREIMLVDPDYIGTVQSEFEKLMSSPN